MCTRHCCRLWGYLRKQDSYMGPSGDSPSSGRGRSGELASTEVMSAMGKDRTSGQHGAVGVVRGGQGGGRPSLRGVSRKWSDF